MDSKAIETLSISAVRNAIVVCDYLDQFIPDNDKEPSWDGSVYIYKDKSKRKDKLRGRVAVQVKGKEVDLFEDNEISYSTEVVDLENFLFDGGAVYFVVYINKDFKTKIYYCELTPVKLRQYLTGAHKYKTITLKPFPEDNKAKADIFLNFFENSLMQSSFVKSPLLSLEQLQMDGFLEAITIPMYGYDIKNYDPYQALVDNEVYLYAKIKGFNIPLPIDAIPIDKCAIYKIQNAVFVEDTLFYSEYTRRCSNTGDEIKIGESLTLTIDREKRCAIKYKITPMLRQRIRDLEFVIRIFEARSFTLGTVTFPINPSNEEINKFNIKQKKEDLIYFKKMVKALEYLNVKSDLDLSRMTQEDINNIHYLVNAFVEKQPVSYLKPDLPSVLCIRILNLKFLLVFSACKGESGTYNISDFFQTKLDIACEDSEGNMVPISQYALLKQEDLLSVSNIRYEFITKSYMDVPISEIVIEKANWTLLDLLAAYDKSKPKRQDMLMAAKELATWLYNIKGDIMLDKNIRTINLLQTIKRERKLQDDEIELLYAIIEANKSMPSLLVGAYLLLDNHAAAQIYFTKLNENQQTAFYEYPIYYFWHSTENEC